ncbi:MAG: phosphoadenylyl-sulfate reductase [Sandaracinus sp.]|nr:phosphoadenylyl-sulfate reductase [Sandaracinus sp.]|tara:strand:+ start:4493 stop:5248 length:756 start_codon:yes stop_codon:yes gene_type:complete
METPAATPLEADELERANAMLDGAEATDVVEWAAGRFGKRLVMSSSFGAHSAVMLHLVHRIAPRTPVILIDTGYLFPETYRFADDLQRRLDLNLHVTTPAMTAARQEALFGNLWEQGEEGVKEYLRINKVEPMQRALHELGAEAWLAGLRADQTAHRAGLRRVDVQNGRIKVHPILHWSSEDVASYLERHDLPVHPLLEEGYRSIGDVHSTLPTTADMDPRDGRILGKSRECGLHLPMSEDVGKSLKSSGL